LNALLKFVTANNVHSAIKLFKRKKLMMVHKKHKFPLIDVVDKGYMFISKPFYSSFSLVYYDKFAKAWGITPYRKTTKMVFEGLGAIQWDSCEIEGSGDPKGQPYTGLKIHFCSTKAPKINMYGEMSNTWKKPLAEMKKEVNECGGEVVDAIADADVIVILNDSVDVDATDNQVVTDQDLFISSLPSIDELKKGLPTKKFTGDSAAVWKLLIERDISSIQQGLALVSAMPDMIDTLLDGCTVDAEGKIIRSRKFTVSGPATSYLDIALFGLLSAADPDSVAGKLRQSIKILDLNISALPTLNGFDALESLTLQTDNTFEAEDVSVFGPLPSLKTLYLNGKWQGIFHVKSLNGLDAPQLEELKVDHVNLADISALSNCTKLKKVSVQYCPVESIDALAASAETLEEIDFYDCAISSVKALSACKKLKWINLRLQDDATKPLYSIEGLEDMKLDKDCMVSLSLTVQKPMTLGDLIKVSLRSDIEGVKVETVYTQEHY
jgi:hypothetical protein